VLEFSYPPPVGTRNLAEIAAAIRAT